jgi:hypothetical protein
LRLPIAHQFWKLNEFLMSWTESGGIQSVEERLLLELQRQGSRPVRGQGSKYAPPIFDHTSVPPF